MTTFYHETEGFAMRMSAALCGDALPWAECDEWLEHYATWFHCMRDGQLIGFLAWVDDGDGKRWLHYGVVKGARNVGGPILRGFRVAIKQAHLRGVDLIAYIKPDQPDVLRLAKALGFTSTQTNIYEQLKTT